MIPPTLNGIPALAVRLSIPWRGVWYAEVELDAPDATLAQLLADSATPVVLMLGATPLSGVVDPTSSGTFGGRTTLRVVGGRNGWGKSVTARHFVQPGGGLTSSVVLAATGAEVGEVVADAVPVLLGTHYARANGPASDAFGNRQWYVDPITTTTLVNDWPPNTTLGTLLDFVAYDVRAIVSAEDPIFPGTVLIDERFNGASYVVRDVEQSFTPEGSVAHCFCGDNPTTRAADVFAALVRGDASSRYLKTYRYRFVLPAAGKMILQSVNGDAPDLNPIEQWSGLSGSVDVHAPGTEIVVGFADGDPSQPYVAAYGPDAVPLQIALTAAASITLTAPAIAIAGTSTFGVPGTAQSLAFGAWASALQGALSTFAASLAAATTIANVAAAGAALSTAIGSLPPSSTLFLKGN